MEILMPPAQELVARLQDTTLPDPDLLSYYALEKERIIYLDYDVDPTLTTIHRLIVRWNMEDTGIPPEKRKPIRLFVMSFGGDMYYMWMLIDAILASDTPVYTINIGVAHSAAALIFMSGDMRYMSRNAKVLIHEGQAEMAGDAVKVMDAADNYKRDLKQMKEFIEKQTEVPHSVIIKKRNNDWTLDADYCLEHKVCDVVFDHLSEVLP